MKRKIATALPEPTEAEIQRAAYFIWLDSGKPVGRELEHWHAAREMLCRHPVSSSSSPRQRRVRAPFFPVAPGRLAHN